MTDLHGRLSVPGTHDRLTVSVVIPAYRATAHLSQAVRSAQQQTLKPLEVLVVDDESPDETFALAERLGATALRTGTNGGPAKARNVGVRAARGDLVAFLDADDYWEPNHLSEMTRIALMVPEAGVVFGHPRVFDGALTWELQRELPEGAALDLSRLLPRRNYVGQTVAVVRRALFLQLGGYDEDPDLRFAEDYDLWLRMSRHTKFACSHATTGNYRVHASQATHHSARARLFKTQTRVRAKMLARLTSERAEDLVHFRAQALRAWQDMLQVAWHFGDQNSLDSALEVADLVPDSDPTRAQWIRRRRSFIWPVWRSLTILRHRLKALAVQVSRLAAEGRAWARRL